MAPVSRVFATSDERRAASEAYGRMLREVRELADGLPVDQMLELRTEACAAFWRAWEARDDRDPVEAVMVSVRVLLDDMHHPAAGARLSDQERQQLVLDAITAAQSERPGKWLLPALILAELGLGSIREWDAIHALSERDLVEINARGHLRLQIANRISEQLEMGS